MVAQLCSQFKDQVVACQNNKTQGSLVTKLVKQVLAVSVVAMSISACYGQWGVAAGAGVEQWNRSRELDMQQQQIELQRKSMEMEERQFLLEKERRERERRRADEDQRQYAEFIRKREEHMGIIQEYAAKNGGSGRFVSNKTRQALLSFNRTNYPVRLTEFELISLLNIEKEKAEKEFDDELNSQITKLFNTHDEYKNERNKAVFHEEMNKLVSDAIAGKVTAPDSTSLMVETIHVRVLNRLLTEKSNKKPAQKKVQG